MTYLAAVIQMTSTSNKAANLEKAERMIRLAAARGARLVALPETFNWRGQRTEEAAAAEDLSGNTLTAMGRLAREQEIYLLAGSITEHVPGESRRYNTSVLFAPNGMQLAMYRKIHLFDIDLPGRVTVKESAVKMPGSEIATVATDLGTVGLSVCYDVRFPELYRRLVYAGANIVTIPSAFTFPTGEAHWEVLIRARAIENQCYVLAPAQFGTNVHGFADYGNSMIVDPWGRVLARAADQEGVLVAPIDMEYLERVRRELPSLTHARLR
ncbi:MAG: carbon-nitrogen hydrolase family protein [Deltaproteobacteria bacterium]|nr:carbon-nitrogen hydrolase family protein [Deltaproteobacteria bacterium]